MNSNVDTLRYAKAAHAKLEHGHESGVDSRRGHGGHSQVNVGEFERQVSLISGTVLAVCGLLRGSMSGLGLAAIGAGLIWRGHTGHCEVYHALGHSSADEKPVAV
jgi:uncharacterized membrane protein